METPNNNGGGASGENQYCAATTGLPCDYANGTCRRCGAAQPVQFSTLRRAEILKQQTEEEGNADQGDWGSHHEDDCVGTVGGSHQFEDGVCQLCGMDEYQVAQQLQNRAGTSVCPNTEDGQHVFSSEGDPGVCSACGYNLNVHGSRASRVSQIRARGGLNLGQWDDQNDAHTPYGLESDRSNYMSGRDTGGVNSRSALHTPRSEMSAATDICDGTMGEAHQYDRKTGQCMRCPRYRSYNESRLENLKYNNNNNQETNDNEDQDKGDQGQVELESSRRPSHGYCPLTMGFDHVFKEGVCDCGFVQPRDSEPHTGRQPGIGGGTDRQLDPDMCPAASITNRLFTQRLDNFIAHIALGLAKNQNLTFLDLDFGAKNCLQWTHTQMLLSALSKGSNTTLTELTCNGSGLPLMTITPGDEEQLEIAENSLAAVLALNSVSSLASPTETSV